MYRNKGFTVIELIFVIIAVGILAAMIIPRLEINGAREAATQMLTHIRYAQHLAMQDDKFVHSENEKFWFKMRWGIAINDTSLQECSVDEPGVKSWKYSIFYDKRGSGNKFSGNLNSKEEVAIDTQKSNKFLSAGWRGIPQSYCNKINIDLNIEKKYGIKSVKFVGSCGKGKTQTIDFDELGRPMRVVSVTGNKGAKRPYSRLLKGDCKIVLTDKNNNVASINIEKRSGYAYIN
ncbi:pilus assembly FimT family protein [Campylobacter concisus]|jgi:N-methylation|uniref:pilus assembly FimT family protein n=1 Tax=Campylobacter concisus TaxID=199 RepID=UPI003D2325DE